MRPLGDSREKIRGNDRRNRRKQRPRPSPLLAVTAGAAVGMLDGMIQAGIWSAGAEQVPRT